MKTCDYAVVQFLPYRETGEFVNVGVVLFCREAGFFDVMFESQKRKRVTDFFPEMDEKMFMFGRQAFYEELRRIKGLLCPDMLKLDDAARMGVFRELVRPRESVFRFGETRSVLAHDPAAMLTDLYERYVNRQFAQTREYQETVMAHRLTAILRDHSLMGSYHLNQRVGNEEFHVILPIVSQALNEHGVVRRAIKPLDLDRDEPTKIYEHGDSWIKRVQRLQRINQLPEVMLFTVNKATTDERRVKACFEITTELEHLNVRVLTFGDEQGVVDFARMN